MAHRPKRAEYPLASARDRLETRMLKRACIEPPNEGKRQRRLTRAGEEKKEPKVAPK